MTLVLPRPQMLLMALCCLLGAILAYELAVPLGDIAVPAITLRGSSAATLPQQRFVSVPPLAAFAAFNDRPIFSPQRKAIAPAPVGAAAAAPPPPPAASLVGIIIDAQRRIALIRTASSPLATAVAVGDTLQGWQVTEIAPDRVVLHQGTTDDALKLDANRAPPSDDKTTPQK
jgi:hypothetical protein